MVKKYKVKIKIDKKVIAVISLAVIIFASILIYKKLEYYFLPVTKVNYYGILLTFRSDLKQAKLTPVYPSDQYFGIFRNPNIRNIYICFRNTTNNSLVAVEAYEITYKLKTFYNLARVPVEIQGKNVTYYGQIKGNSTSLVIYIIPPVDANGTYVNITNYTVYVSGTSVKNLDYATEKLLIGVLGIKP